MIYGLANQAKLSEDLLDKPGHFIPYMRCNNCCSEKAELSWSNTSTLTRKLDVYQEPTVFITDRSVPVIVLLVSIELN